jgi:signal transduction histidine kinase/DNA-binding response OmpR family regulator
MSASRSDSVRRFDVAVQTSHIGVFSIALIVALFGRALGVFGLSLKWAIVGWLGSSACSLIFRELFRRGADRRILNPIWIAVDIVWPTIGVAVTGGINSPWFIWYLAIASGAAFAATKRTVYVVSVANTLAYLGVLMWLGQIRFADAAFLLALTRMLFLFGASFFFLMGVSDLREKRRRIRELEAEESKKIAELTRLADVLRERTEELASANLRIQESDRLKSQFLANMSHELRTPMNSIIGFSEILVERLDGKVEAKHVSFLRHILASGQHLLGIINDILDLSKIEAGKMEIFPERFDVRQVIESVCHVMRGMSRIQPNLIIEVPEDMPQIVTDLAKFKQILFNLLSNAVKFSPPERAVTIRAQHMAGEEDDGMVTVSVRDEGIGIDPKDHEVIFEEFRQVDGTVKREFGGTGLGLALVKKFVELQGGTVRVDSAPGRGSIFSFTLPVSSKAMVASPLQALPHLEEVVSRPGDRVLVVEDDAHAYDLISAALATAGYVSVRARHGEEAVRLALEARPVAITLDLVLPGFDGWEVLKRLKSDRATRDIPVVIISMIENRELGVALGADDYFVKPVDRERMLERIRKLTSGRAARTRLLLIDDDTAVHTLLEEELAALGYTVDSAFTGESGVRAARAITPDLIILDLMMPGMSGFEVAGLLKEDAATANIPIVVLTSREISAADRRELQSQVTMFVQKGTSAREQLVREIQRLEQRRANG